MSGKGPRTRRKKDWGLGNRVGRRDFLKGAAGGCAALGLGRMLTSCGGDDTFVPPWRVAATRTYLFQLSHCDPSHAFYLSMSGGKGRLLPLDEAALAELSGAYPELASLPPGTVTHYGHFELPADSIKLCYVYGVDPARAVNYLALAFMHFPARAETAVKAGPHACPPAELEAARVNRLRFLGIDGKAFSGWPSCVSANRDAGAGSSPSGPPAPDPCTSVSDLKCIFDLACTMTNVHLEVLSFDATTAAAIYSHIASLPSTNSLAFEILGLLRNGNPTQVLADESIDLGWAVQYPVPDPSKPGTYRKYSQGPRQGQTIYTVAWKNDDALLSKVNANIEATLAYVKETYYANTTGASAKKSALQGKLCQVRDGTPYVAQAAPQQAAARHTWGTGGSTFNYAFRSVSNHPGMKTELDSMGDTQVKFSASNWYVRYLVMGIQYLDAAGNPMKLSSLAPATQTWAAGTDLSYANTDETVVVTLLAPELTLYGIPIEQGDTDLEVPYDGRPSGIRVLAGGLGSHGKVVDAVTEMGIAYTSVFNLGIPTMFLISNAAIDYSVFAKTITDSRKLMYEIAELLVSELIGVIKICLSGSSDPLKDMGLEMAKFVFSLAAKPGFAWLWGQLVATLGAGEAAESAEEAVPIVGWILAAVEIASLVATLAETVAEVILSPFTYESEMTLTHDVTVTVHPSQCPSTGQTFPEELWSGNGGYYEIKLVLDDASAFSSGQLSILSYSSKASSDPIAFTFQNVPYGGKVSASIGMYSAGGYLLGACSTGDIPNEEGTATQDSSGRSPGCADPGPSPSTDIQDTGGDLSITLTINEKKVPLTTGTQYDFLQKSALDSSGNHVWDSTASAPAATADDLSPEVKPGHMEAVYAVTVNEIEQAVGYSWRSSSQKVSSYEQVGLFANLALNGDPQNGYMLSSDTMGGGMAGALPVKIAYDLMSPSNNFFVDTTGGNYMVRGITFSGPGSAPTFSTSESYGRFSLPSDGFVVHPSGSLYSINREYSKIEKIDLKKHPGLPVADANAPLAQSLSGTGSREGLLDGPVCMAAGADGTIFVLEAGNGRIQAFDAGLSPVKHFQNKTSYYLTLKDRASQAYTYVGLAVEYTGYLYVLSYEISSYTYRLDIYTPQGHFLCRTTGVNAGGVAVDYWRTVYTVNYEVLMKPHQTLPDVTEPSVSVWLPSLPS